MQPGQGGGLAVAAVTAFQGGQAGEEATLALVEQVDEEFSGGGQGAAGQDLSLAPLGLGRAVEEAAVELLAGETVAMHEVAQGIAARDMQEGFQFGDEVAGVGGAHQRFGCGAQRAMGGEADALEGPQAVLVEARGRGQGVIATGVGIAGEVGDEGELAHDGAAGGGAEGGHELRHGGDGFAFQQVDEGAEGVERGTHGAESGSIRT